MPDELLDGRPVDLHVGANAFDKWCPIREAIEADLRGTAVLRDEGAKDFAGVGNTSDVERRGKAVDSWLTVFPPALDFVRLACQTQGLVQGIGGEGSELVGTS